MENKMFGGKPFEYPKNHKLGMRIPEGGSMCDNCSYLGKDHKTCTNKEWIKWNNNNNKLPFNDEEYCCDLYEIGNKKGLNNKDKIMYNGS